MVRFSLVLIIWSGLLSAQAGQLSSNDASPYIRMHVTDAVKWQQWDRSVIERARKENKLILVSSGYFACHWCHVMQRESFNDRQVARLLNTRFIAVKIDREQMPILDAYLLEFMQGTQGHGGWPLNVFLTPQGYPLTGLVYQPRNEFLNLLKRLDEKWQKEPVDLSRLAVQIFQKSLSLRQDLRDISTGDLVELYLSEVVSSMDDIQGGFGDQSKFPRPYLLLSLLRMYEINRDKELREFLVLTLNQMATQGLHDAVGGGFFRYTTEPGWQGPHFEKMLYTNAAMIQLYLKAYHVLGDKKWLSVATETLDFILREMSDGRGGYVSALSAMDKYDVEGGSYLWEKSVLVKLVGKQSLEKLSLKEQAQGSLYMPTGLWLDDVQQKYRKSLLKKRSVNPPAKDEKFIVAWNAYLLVAMIELMEEKPDEKYHEAIEKLYSRLSAEEVKWRKPGIAPAMLQDYVYMIEAVVKWQQFSGLDKGRVIERLVEKVLDDYVIEGGWRLTSDQVIPMPELGRNMPDGDLPASDVVFRRVLSGLPGRYTKRLVEKQGELGELESRVMSRPMAYPGLIQERMEGEGIVPAGLKTIENKGNSEMLR